MEQRVTRGSVCELQGWRVMSVECGFVDCVFFLSKPRCLWDLISLISQKSNPK